MNNKELNYYEEIKNKLINNEINRRVKNYSINKSDMATYYSVGKMLYTDFVKNPKWRKWSNK